MWPDDIIFRLDQVSTLCRSTKCVIPFYMGQDGSAWESLSTTVTSATLYQELNFPKT